MEVMKNDGPDITTINSLIYHLQGNATHFGSFNKGQDEWWLCSNLYRGLFGGGRAPDDNRYY